MPNSYTFCCSPFLPVFLYFPSALKNNTSFTLFSNIDLIVMNSLIFLLIQDEFYCLFFRGISTGWRIYSALVVAFFQHLNVSFYSLHFLK